jgi:hypothetical protein
MKALLSLFLVLSLNVNANVFDDIGSWVKGAADDTGDWFEGTQVQRLQTQVLPKERKTAHM